MSEGCIWKTISEKSDDVTETLTVTGSSRLGVLCSLIHLFSVREGFDHVRCPRVFCTLGIPARPFPVLTLASLVCRRQSTGS